MKKIVTIIVLIGTMILSASELNIVNEKSNSYFKAKSDVLFFGSDDIIGVNKKLTGSIIYKNGTITGGGITIYVNGFDTQNKRRDNHILEILNADTYPKITFLIKEQYVKDKKQFIRGNLSINGINKVKDIPVKISKNDNEVKIVGKISIKYKDFGIEPPSMGGFIKQADENIEIGGQFIFAKDIK